MSSIAPVTAGGFTYLSGVTGSDERGDVGAATTRLLERAGAMLADAGSSLERAVSILVLLKSPGDFQPMNDAYRAFWPASYPTRTTLITELAEPGALVEMSVVAAAAGADRVVIHPSDWAVSPSPYSYAIRSGDVVFLSGLVSRRGRDNSPVSGDVAVQTRVILENAGELLDAAGLSHANVVCSRVYLPDVASFGAMNGAYRPFFPSSPPARATVQTSLAGPQYSVEITCTATTSPRRAIREGLPANVDLPLSAAIAAGDRVYLSGALGYNDSNRGNVSAQARETLDRLGRTMAASGVAPSDVVEAVVFVTDLSFVPAVERECRAFFAGHMPSTMTIRAGLVAPDALVEIMATAVKR